MCSSDLKTDGSKFGKTASGSVWLDPGMTSPYAFYQYWIQTADADVISFLKVFTFLSKPEIDELETSVATDPGARAAQRALARELTTMVHSKSDCDQAELAAKALFGQGDQGILEKLEEKTLISALQQLPSTEIESIDEIPTWIDLAAATGVVDSKSAARRIVKEGGAYLNNLKVEGEIGRAHV